MSDPVTVHHGNNNLDDANKSFAYRMNPFVEYFKSHGDISQPGRYGEPLSRLPCDIEELCRIVQGLIIPPDRISDCGVSIPEDRVYSEQQARTVLEILDTVLHLEGRSLAEARPPELRAVGTSRNSALLLCSILRTQNIAARLRCGFAPYIRAGRFEDHWICEYWSDAEKYWVRVDPQLDALQCQSLAVGFDPHDVPIDAYLYAGEVWVMCRRGRVDPDLCGNSDLRGLGFIKADIVRDILALNKIEAMPWDSGWGIVGSGLSKDVERSQLSYIDRLARCSANSLVHLAHSFFADDERIRFPERWDLSMAPTLRQLMDDPGCAG